jgi:hypothetical protein
MNCFIAKLSFIEDELDFDLEFRYIFWQAESMLSLRKHRLLHSILVCEVILLAIAAGMMVASSFPLSRSGVHHPLF